MMRTIWQNVALTIVSICIIGIALEIIVRLMIQPSPISYGRFLGYELPPYKLATFGKPAVPTDRDKCFDGLVVGGKKITLGDLWGFHRADTLMGYASQENLRSKNGWWQSNSLGARSHHEWTFHKESDVIRLLVFGDSFAQATRVPQDKTWPEILGKNQNIEVMNFGVDGYSMGQSFLRYQTVMNRIDHDIVLLMFVPLADLWRDVNVVRDLAVNGWDDVSLMPRFFFDTNRLRLARGPVWSWESEYRTTYWKPLVRRHLIKYDRFFSEKIESDPWLIGSSILYKLFMRLQIERFRLNRGALQLEPESEAVSVSIAIFLAMQEEVKRHAKEFIVVMLPTHRDFTRFHNASEHRKNWNTIKAMIQQKRIHTIDLLPDMEKLPKNQFDKGHDGSHYGPNANKIIAKLIGNYLISNNILTKLR